MEHGNQRHQNYLQCPLLTHNAQQFPSQMQLPALRDFCSLFGLAGMQDKQIYISEHWGLFK